MVGEASQTKARDGSAPGTATGSGPEFAQTETTLSLPGWEASSLPRTFQIRQILRHAPIPSPLADLGIRRAEWTAIVNHLRSSVHKLFHAIADRNIDVEALKGDGFTEKGRSSIVCSLEDTAGLGDNGCYVDSDDESDQDDGPDLRWARIKDDCAITMAFPEDTLHLRRLKRESSREYRYFIVNASLAPLFINGISVGIETVAGPLPDFAVLEIQDAVYLWWGVPATLDYVPDNLPSNSINLKRSVEATNGFENLSDKLPSVKRRRIDKGSTLSTRRSFTSSPFGKKPTQLPQRNETPPRTLENLRKPSPIPRVTNTSNLSNSHLDWIPEYDRRVKACTKTASNRSDHGTPRREPHHLANPNGLDDHDVFLAIASIWRGLMDEGTLFAFGSPNLFESARLGFHHGMASVLSPSPLIIPLIFNARATNSAFAGELFEHLEPKPVKPVEQTQQLEKQREYQERVQDILQKSLTNEDNPRLEVKVQEAQKTSYIDGIRHVVLAIAERIDLGKAGNSVRLIYYDSSPTLCKPSIIRQAARNVVRNSYWMCQEHWPTWAEEEWPRIAIQGDNNNSGIHVILNAWAHMLNMPLAESRETAGNPYSDARRMISLALQGRLDSVTIRAFMQAYKFMTYQGLGSAQSEDMEDPHSGLRLRRMQSAVMNEQILNEVIEFLQTKSRSQPPDEPGNLTPAKLLVPTPLEIPRLAPDVPEIASDKPTEPRVAVKHSDVTRREKKTWRAIYTMGMRHHSRRYEEQSEESKARFTRISTSKSDRAMEDQSVVYAIGSVWEGLRRSGRNFSYNTAYTFRTCRKRDDTLRDSVAVLGPNPFIMPLLFNARDVGTPSPNPRQAFRYRQPVYGAMGHLLLAVAERVQENVVQIVVMDSMPGSVSKKMIREAAQGLVENSGWLGFDDQARPLRVKVTFAAAEYRQVPFQTGINACGLYVILNAWAYMLDIPVRKERYTRPPIRIANAKDPNLEFSDSAFLVAATQIINRALAGYMDTATIQAFFQVWGYVEDQDVDDANVHVASTNTVAMDDNALGTIVRRQRTRELLDVPLTSSFPDANIDILMEVGSKTREQASRYLAMARGNVQDAVTNILRTPSPVPAPALAPAPAPASASASASAPAPIAVPPEPRPPRAFSDKDIETVMNITERSREEAIHALESSKGEVNAASMFLLP